MFKYIADISTLSQNIIKTYCSNFKVAIDATLGNGHDTDFLSDIFSEVYAFDIQQCAIEAYELRKKDNVILINDSHHKFEYYIQQGIDCIMYNLGFLPGGNKSITTKSDTTLKSIKLALDMLNSGGIITIAIYSGHHEGKIEKENLMDMLRELPTDKFAVMIHTYFNRKNHPPMLAVIEKK